MNKIQDSPVEKRRKELPKGNCNWNGYDSVYAKLQKAAHKMASNYRTFATDEHIETMAILGCGHEETMKAHLMWCREYGWIE